MELWMFDKKRILAIIPARGGSKRIPKKNIIPLGGKPMIHWSIEAAKKCPYIDRVLVSTDCPEIKKISEQAGAEVPFLRVEAADDFTPVSETTLSALQQSEQLWGEFDIVVQLMANCPFRDARVISEGIEQFLSDDRKSQVSYFKYGWMNPWWAHKISEGQPKPLFPEALKNRSQDLEELYCPTGSIWITESKFLKQFKTFYSPGFRSHVIDWISALDIDDEDDLLMAQAVLKLQHDK
jgi:CMP-N-acetylneuraminic acid synthetase